MRDKLPASVLQRSKIGFDIPAHEWLRGPLRALLLETLAAGVAEHGELFRSGGDRRFRSPSTSNGAPTLDITCGA